MGGGVDEREVAELSRLGRTKDTVDSVGFAVAYKGTFLEVFEVVIMVLTLGTTSGSLLIASITAKTVAFVIFGVGTALSSQDGELQLNIAKKIARFFGISWLEILLV